jgi:hypothetical protein
MKTLLLYLPALILAAMSAAGADTISGKWRISQAIAGNESSFACTFTQSGEDLSGTCENPAKPMKISGKVTEKKVTWTITTEYNDAPITLTYSGTLQPENQISGIVTVEQYGVEGEFTASPVK